MVNTSLNIDMGNIMRRCMRKRHLTQDSLAQYLGEDRKTVSLILAGKMMPSFELLEKMLLGIGADCDTKSKVREMGRRLRLGVENKTVWTYANLRSLRERRGLTIPMLSNRTGIATSRIAALENGEDTPTEKEDSFLRRTLDGKFELSCFDRDRSSGDGRSAAAIRIPLLAIDDLTHYSKHMRLIDIVMERSLENVYWELDILQPPTAVLADCRRLQLTVPGFAVLIVTENSEIPASAVELWYDGQGGFSLREYADGTWIPVGMTASDAVLAPKAWSLPVADMVFKPFGLKKGACDK